jgi:hypothetical protein
MTDVTLLGGVVESFGAMRRVLVDDVSPAMLSTVQIIFDNGVLTVWAIDEDDSIGISVDRAYDSDLHEVSRDMPWSVLVGGDLLWIWTMTNHQGYVDGIQFASRVRGADVSLQLIVMASSLKPYLVVEDSG